MPKMIGIEIIMKEIGITMTEITMVKVVVMVGDLMIIPGVEINMDCTRTKIKTGRTATGMTETTIKKTVFNQ